MATLTQQQTTGLNAAAARLAAGSANQADKDNLAYAQKTYGYTAPVAPTVPTTSSTNLPGLNGNPTAQQIQPTSNAQGVITQPTVAPPVVPTAAASSPYAAAATYAGPSVVDFLNKAGQPTDFSSRAKLAQTYGIQGYTGTANQNNQLLGLLKSHATGNVTDLGIPKNINNITGAKGTIPTPTDVIPANSLPKGNQELSKVLGANVGTDTVSSDIAGLLALYGKSSDSEAANQKSQQDLLTAMGSLGQEGADLKAAMDANGVGAAYEQVKSLNLKAAQLKGELEQFDAETLQGKSGIEDQAIPTGLITGQQAQYQKQRDLTRIGKAADLSATIALSQAYQGNAQLGLELAGKAVDLKYQPILNNINVLKTQLGFATDKMTKEDAKRASIINALLDIKKTQVTAEKKVQTDIQTLAVQAASNGAPLAVVTAMRNATDAIAAAQAGATYLKGNLEKAAGSGSSAGTFTQTQLNKGAANAGIPIADFSKLSSDAKNYYINNYATFNKVLSDVRAGKEDSQTVIQELQSSNIPDDVKLQLIRKVRAIAPDVAQNSGGFINGVGNFFSGAFNGVKSILGF